MGLTTCVADVAFYGSLLPSYQWVQTGVRVAGSWIVAIALLMLAFALRHQEIAAVSLPAGSFDANRSATAYELVCNEEEPPGICGWTAP